jgi:hypothetical protein
VAGVALVAALFVLEMSGSAQRTAGSNRIRPDAFSAIVPAGGTLCQPAEPIPPDAQRASILIGTYSRPMPALSLRFLDSRGMVVAGGKLPADAPADQGYVMIPLLRTPRAPAAASACLHVAGSGHYALGGENVAISPGSAVVDGKRQPGVISVFYYRRGSETWWQLLPVLDRRFALGKAAFFGGWALPAVALVALLVWVATVRLLRRELA